jgi:hypothetical protein
MLRISNRRDPALRFSNVSIAHISSHAATFPSTLCARRSTLRTYETYRYV